MTNLPVPVIGEAQLLLEKLVARPPQCGPCRVNRQLVLYGAGNMGRLAADLLQRLQIPVEYAVDRSPPADRMLAGRIPVIKPDEVPREHLATHLIGVCVVFAPYGQIHWELANMGWRHIVPFYDIAETYVDRVPMGNGWFSGPLEAGEKARIDQVLSCWDDDHSRAAHLQFLAWRLHREEWYFPDAPVTIDNRFFIPPVLNSLRPDEFFVDAGAYRGTVIRRFIHETNGKFRGIAAIEPDRENVSHLRSLVAQSVNSAITLHECALGRSEGTAPFRHGLDMGSRLDSKASENVHVFRLDDLYLPLSFIKLHVEGGEYDALLGGLRSLRDNRPLLAVTVYHSRDGLWKIPHLLMSELENYAFYFRLHAWCGTGGVMYGIPRERSAKN